MDVMQVIQGSFGIHCHSLNSIALKTEGSRGTRTLHKPRDRWDQNHSGEDGDGEQDRNAKDQRKPRLCK